MRQAGRYLPDYRAIKERHSLESMFKTPEIAAEITCLPIPILKVDAAILFADILTLPAAMGIEISFDAGKGPVINTSFKVEDIHDFSGLEYIQKTITLSKNNLPAAVPLIGFAGSPFTVLTYMIEGGSSINFNKTMHLLAADKKRFHKLMSMLTENTIRYLQLQKEAGIDAFQLFDTWAGILRGADYAHFVLPYIKQIFDSLDLPSIYYVKNCRHLLKSMDLCAADVLSVCHTVNIGDDEVLANTDKGIQGNLYNGLLYAGEETLQEEVRILLAAAQKHKKYIFNLSHGVFPDVDVNKLKLIVETVHQFKWKNE